MFQRVASIGLVSVWLALSVEPALAQGESVEPERAENAEPAPEAVEPVPRLLIREFRVSGNSTLGPTEIERVLYPFTGAGKTLASIDEARLALEKYYQDKGFPTVAVNLPPQNVAGGVVELQVMEGRTNIVSISGAEYFKVSDIRAQLPGLQPGGVLFLPEAREQLAEVNRINRDLAVTPILKPGVVPGTLDIELKVKDELPVHGRFELNNRYTENSTKTRLSGNLSYDNLWQRSHSASLQYQVSPEDLDQVAVLVGTYVFPVTDTGKMALYAVRSESDIPAVDVLSVLGKGFILGLRWIEPLTPGLHYFHNFTFGFDYKDFDDQINQFAGSTEQGIEYSQFSLNYTGNYLADTSRHMISAGMTFAPEGMGNRADEFRAKRDINNGEAFSRPSYAYWKIENENTWFNENAPSLFLKLGSQFTDALLISNEQISIGGEDTVRGYLDSTASGDYGGYGQFELRSRDYVEADLDIKSLQWFGFIDVGMVKQHEVQTGQTQKFYLQGRGLGLRMKGQHGWFADLAWARAVRAAGSVRDGDNRVHCVLGYEF
jgi:hemolysin activation/secretion protein